MSRMPLDLYTLFKDYEPIQPKETKMNDKFFIYAITNSSVKKYFVTNDQLLSFYQVADIIIRPSTNQKCIFLDNGVSFLWEDINELSQNLDL